MNEAIFKRAVLNLVPTALADQPGCTESTERIRAIVEADLDDFLEGMQASGKTANEGTFSEFLAFLRVRFLIPTDPTGPRPSLAMPPSKSGRPL